jgi:phospholipid-translocating ATPase
MVFQKCSIGGKVYASEMDTAAPQEEKDMGAATEATHPALSPASAEPTSKAQEAEGKPSTSTAVDSGIATPAGSTSLGTSSSSVDKSPKAFYSKDLAQDLADAVQISDPSSQRAIHARSLNGFLSVLALCHTVLTSVDPQTGRIQYKAQSPDEAALVQAAADVGYVFKGKDHDVLTLEKPGLDGDMVEERYELLNILEFNSSRKRMSVVLRRLDDEDDRLFLLTKGADNVIFERLKEGVDQGLRELTEMHLGEFASEGLRTLTLAYKFITSKSFIPLFAVCSFRFRRRV